MIEGIFLIAIGIVMIRAGNKMKKGLNKLNKSK